MITTKLAKFAGRAGVAAGAVALAAALAACGAPPATRGDGGGAGAPPAAPRTVRTAPAASTSVAWTEAPGTVEAVRAAAVASRLSAVIERVLVEEGDAVRRGDVLVRLDDRDVAAQVAAAQAVSEAAAAQRDRIRSLFGKEAATKQELEQADREAAAAKAQLDYIVLRAPLDGRVVDKRAAAGDLALPGQKLLTIEDPRSLRAAATVAESDARRLAIGRPIDAILDDGSTVQARVAIINPAADPVSRRVVVKCDLPAGAAARPGSFVRLRLPAGPMASPMALAPRTALVEHGALTGLYVVEEGRARLRWVSLGAPVGQDVLVRAGLSPGEEIVLEPAGVSDGAAVRPAAQAAAP